MYIEFKISLPLKQSIKRCDLLLIKTPRPKYKRSFSFPLPDKCRWATIYRSREKPTAGTYGNVRVKWKGRRMYGPRRRRRAVNRAIPRPSRDRQTRPRGARMRIIRIRFGLRICRSACQKPDK